MSAYLIKTVETYRLPTEEAVKDFLEEQKKDNTFEIIKYSSTKKEIKEKGEIVEQYYRLEITKIFADEKDPYEKVVINYQKEEY